MALTPAQQRVLDELFDPAAPRPQFPDNLRDALRTRLEDELAGAAARLGKQTFFVGKHTLANVHGCETHYLLEAESGPPGIAGARGTVAHKAIELGFGLRDKKSPATLVDLAIDRFKEEPDRWPGDVLTGASEVEMAELRTSAVEAVSKLEDSFPPLQRAWRPRIESPLRADLCGEAIRVSGRLDLALFQPEGTRAGVLILDFKSGWRSPADADDLRLYALLETLRCGVPPWRIATFYLDAGTWLHEDVTLDTLELAVRRVVDAVHKMVELHIDGREPKIAPGPPCGWCVARATCSGAARWAEQRDDVLAPVRLASPTPSA